jgi:hypothetical protein
MLVHITTNNNHAKYNGYASFVFRQICVIL